MGRGVVNRENEALLTQEYLKSILEYNPETGIFTWIKRNGNIAGSFKKSNGYVIIRINKKDYRSHRLAWLYMTGSWPIYIIDHINGINIPNFNAFSNLRELTYRGNSQNSNNKKYNTNTSGYRGVYLKKSTGKYFALIYINRKQTHLGYFLTPEEASIVHEAARLEYYMEELI
jgi:hypothetical protein